MSFELYHLIIFKQKKSVFLHIAFDTDCFNYRHDPKGLRLNTVDKKVSNIRMVQGPIEFRAPSPQPLYLQQKLIPGGLQKRSSLIKVFGCIYIYVCIYTVNCNIQVGNICFHVMTTHKGQSRKIISLGSQK